MGQSNSQLDGQLPTEKTPIARQGRNGLYRTQTHTIRVSPFDELANKLAQALHGYDDLYSQSFENAFNLLLENQYPTKVYPGSDKDYPTKLLAAVRIQIGEIKAKVDSSLRA